MKKEKISVVVPCYNEEESLKYFYSAIFNVMESMNNRFELLFIDDGSTDQTLKIIKDLAKKDSRVRYLSFSRNFGKEAALLAGLKNTTGDYVTIMDADMQDPPDKLIEMYDVLIRENLDVVGLKTKDYNNYKFVRKMFTICYYKILNKLTTVPMTSNERDYRIMTRKVVNAILELKEYNRYSKGIFNYVGFKVKWLTYEPKDRIAGSTKWNFLKLFSYGLDGIISFSTKLLILPSIIGLFSGFISLFLFLTILVFNITSKLIYLVCIMLFLFGIQMFFMGIIGWYISRVYLEVKNRPIYIVKETEQDEILRKN